MQTKRVYDEVKTYLPNNLAARRRVKNLTEDYRSNNMIATPFLNAH